MRIAMLAILTLLAPPQEETLLGTQPLTEAGDLSDKMMEGLHQYIDRRLGESVQARAAHWKRDASSGTAYEQSIAPNRKRFLHCIGVVDPRVPSHLERFGDEAAPALAAESPRFRVWQVRWPVLEGVTGEGLLLEPIEKAVGQVIAVPDADQTPEQFSGLAPGVPAELQLARRLA
jgi:hypothetical protein